MKLLIVSSSILPQSGGSSVIVEQLAANYSAAELVVLGATTWPRKPPPPRPQNGPAIHYFFSELYVMGRGNRFFGWFRKLRFTALVKRIEQLIRSEQIDYVIGVYPTALYCLAASRAARKLNVPFSSYFHNTYIENTAITDAKAPAIQQEIFDTSQHIFVMSEGMQRFYEEKYKLHKFKPLVHTFNAWPDTSALTGIPGQKDCYKLVMIGNFNESNLDATRRLLDAIKNNPRYRVSVFTHVPKLLLQQRGIDTSQLDHRGSVRPEEIHQALQEFDICVLTHGFTGGYGPVEYQTIFPTRTIPFLLSGKPIFAHSPSGSFLNRFLEQHKCAELVAEASTEAIVQGLERIATDAAYQQQLANRANETARNFYGPDVVKNLTNLLQDAPAV